MLQGKEREEQTDETDYSDQPVGLFIGSIVLRDYQLQGRSHGIAEDRLAKRHGGAESGLYRRSRRTGL